MGRPSLFWYDGEHFIPPRAPTLSLSIPTAAQRRFVLRWCHLLPLEEFSNKLCWGLLLFINISSRT